MKSQQLFPNSRLGKKSPYTNVSLDKSLLGLTSLGQSGHVSIGQKSEHPSLDLSATVSATIFLAMPATVRDKSRTPRRREVEMLTRVSVSGHPETETTDEESPSSFPLNRQGVLRPGMLVVGVNTMVLFFPPIRSVRLELVDHLRLWLLPKR